MYTATAATMNVTTAFAARTCAEHDRAQPCLECNTVNAFAAQITGVDLTGVREAADAFLRDCGADVGERVLYRLKALRCEVTWAEYVPSVHGADSRFGRRDAVLFLQAYPADSCTEVIVRVTANYLGTSVTVGAFEPATGHFTQAGAKAEAARCALGM